MFVCQRKGNCLLREKTLLLWNNVDSGYVIIVAKDIAYWVFQKG